MVTFIGAGPGAVDLITVRGKTLLETADIVIYAGSLVNPDLLDYTKKTCETFNSAEMTLEQVIAVMERGEREKKNTVRLHPGSPYKNYSVTNAKCLPGKLIQGVFQDSDSIKLMLTIALGIIPLSIKLLL